MQDTNTVQLLTVGELAALLGVPSSWVYERTKPAAVAKLPHYRAGRYIRFDPSEVLEHLRDENERPDASLSREV